MLLVVAYGFKQFQCAHGNRVSCVDRVVETDADVTPTSLREAGIVKKAKTMIKVLGDGELNRPMKVSAHGFSKSAREKIEAAGGTVTVLGAIAAETENGSEE